ncbi:PREDICTED: Fanconi anemia core complex-associated protein 100 [Cyprinodon variegatus]|uniref:Fanconi anemia core complex-associated protein 100 n=1 Tax=Cyprinodon variegatus TaxID=28743 RepID=UPI000742CCB8|nr:PREDICTED: Fanconi anemia core complex-associated protein 100 [Cyprinodon variegatus]
MFLAVMEGRCAAECWADFGVLLKPGTPLLKRASGTNVFICTGSDEVYVFTTEEKKIKAVVRLPAPLKDLVVSHDEQFLLVACSNGIYSVNLQLLSESTSCDAGSGITELDVTSESLIAVAEGLSSFLLVGSLLLTFCQTDTSWLLTLYKTQGQSQSHTCDLISSFSLPLVSPSVQSHMESKSVLICVYCGNATPLSYSPTASDAGSSCRHFLLQPVLFKLLFGVEAALAKSPVVLCGLPDGRLCFLPLRLPGSRLQVLHSLEQPVVFIGASAVMETDAGCAAALVALGKQGRVLLMEAGRAGSGREGGIASYSKGSILGPVECACVDKSCLYYSTGSDLLALALSEGSAGRERKEDEEASGSRDAFFYRPDSLNVSGVVALDQPTCNAAGEAQLLSLSVRGQLWRISVPIKTRGEGLSTLCSSQIGRSVGDLLSAIGNVCERASVLKTSIGSKNQILKQLNEVINISFLLTDSPNPEDKPIRCRGLVRWSRLLDKDSLDLTCFLENLSPYLLERGWTLSVLLHPLSSFPKAGEGTCSANYSFPFHSLHPGDSLRVCVPVMAAGDASIPVTVTCSLIFSLRSFLGGKGETSFSGLHNGCFSLPLNTLMVDWLHALRMIGPSSAQSTYISPSNSNQADAIQAFISSRQMGCREGDGSSRTGGYSATVRMSSDLLRLQRSKDPKLAPQRSCVSLLEWLLSESCGGVKIGHKEEKMDRISSVVCGRAPNEAPIKLTAKEVNVEEESSGKEEPPVSVEIKVESPSAAAVCGLHHAVLLRIQTLLQKAPEKACFSIKEESSGLRQTLQRAESQRGQISEALSVGMSSGQMHQILLSVYQQLRDSPLLIV